MKETQTVTLDRFKAILDAYGSKEHLWPVDEAEHIQAFLAASEEAKTLLSDVQLFDQLLDSQTKEFSAPSSLMGTILAEAQMVREEKTRTMSQIFRQILKPASGLVLAACVGILIGISSPNLLVSLEDVNLDEISVSDTVLDWELGNDST